MGILKNVKRTDNIIECDYFPENGTSFGHIALNINKKDFIESKCIMEISKTDDFKNDNFKSEYMVAWY